MSSNNTKKPLIGFVASFSNFGETSTLTTIAKKYIEQGGKAIFFGYGKKYQNLAQDIGCKVITLHKKLSEEELKKEEELLKKYYKDQLPAEYFFSRLVHKDFYQSDFLTIKNEVKAFRDNDVELIVTGFDYFSNISARKTNIPLVYIVSGAVIPPYYQQNLAQFPDNYRNFFIMLIPNFIMNYITNWFILNNKRSVKEFKRLARVYNTPKIHHFLDLFSGDFTLVAEDIEFLNLKPTAKFPIQNFVGPIFPETISVKNEDVMDATVKKHLAKPGKTILVSLGSSGAKELFIKILHALEKTQYNVIAIYTSVFNKDEIPDFKDNILLVQFVPSIKKVNASVDIAIIHGGRGTVYTSAYSGKPVIGIPMHIEQQCNIDNLVRHGSAIRLSKRNFSSKKLLKTMDKIFTNYDTFLDNAQLLKEKLPQPKGPENAVKRLLEIYEKR